MPTIEIECFVAIALFSQHTLNESNENVIKMRKYVHDQYNQTQKYRAREWMRTRIKQVNHILKMFFM